MNVDLSEQLRPRARSDADAQAAGADTATPVAWKRRQRQGGQEAGIAAAAKAAQAQRGPNAGSFPRMPPRRGEAQRWERSGKFAKRVCGARFLLGVRWGSEYHQQPHMGK